MEQKPGMTLAALLLLFVFGALVASLPACGPNLITPPVIEDPDPPDEPTLNTPPVAFPPFVASTVHWRQMISIDLRYRSHDCDASGDPIWYTGAYDPDEELLEFWIQVTGPDAEGATTLYSVFDANENRIDSTWLPVDYFDVYHRDRRDPTSPLEQDTIVYCFVGHSAATPYHPMTLETIAMCNDPPERDPDTSTPETFGTFNITYIVRDSKLWEASGTLDLVIQGGPC